MHGYTPPANTNPTEKLLLAKIVLEKVGLPEEN